MEKSKLFEPLNQSEAVALKRFSVLKHLIQLGIAISAGQMRPQYLLKMEMGDEGPGTNTYSKGSVLTLKILKLYFDSKTKIKNKIMFQ